MWPFNTEPSAADQLVKEPSLTSRVRELKQLLASIPEAERWRDALKAAIDDAESALPKTDKVATAYDAVWRALHAARHLLCEHGDVAQLIQAASEIRADLAYNPKRREKEKLLEGLIEKLADAKEGEDLGATRRKLLALSHEAADDREGEWRRANRLIERRKRASAVLIVVLPLCAALLPFAIGDRGRSDVITLSETFIVKWVREASQFGVVMVFGALGGVLSVLIGQSTMSTTTLEHHVELYAARLRSRIGAASALIMYLLILSGVINVGATKPPWLSPMTLLFCVLAGFSERFVVGQLDRISKAVDTSSAKEDSDPNKGRGPANKDNES